MMRSTITLLLACCIGCTTAVATDDDRDVLAVEAAITTLMDSPQPAPQPPSPDTGDQFGGPLDTLREAKELIRKGNDLADRGKALLDAAQRDGKITVDVRLPGVPTPADCPDGRCPVSSPRQDAQPATAQAYDCSSGVCRPRLFWRLRR